MKYTLLIVGALFISVTSCKSSKEVVEQDDVSVERRSNGKERPNVDQMFTKMDVNKDGLLAKSEIKGRLAENFDTIDTNKDGFISKEEMEKAPKPARGGRRGQR